MDGLLKRGHGMDIKLIFIREESGAGVFFELKINFQAEQFYCLIISVSGGGV